jgi:glutamate-1-semialdehyde 2,1-aminomutase
LIFDEIVTGFRFSYGGAQDYYGVTPDLCTLGKIIGGGFPVAAVCGNKEIMKHFDKALVGEENFLPQIGTLSGNPLASVAGLATLNILKPASSYQKVFETGRQLMEGLRAALQDNGHVAQITGEPALFDVFFSDRQIKNYRDVLQSDAGKSRSFNQLLRKQKIFKSDSKFYVSLAHTQDDIDLTISAMNHAAKALKEV